MKLLRLFTPRILSFIDAGIIIISAPVYLRAAIPAQRGIPRGMKFMFAAGSAFPAILLLVIALLCFGGGRRGLIAALVLSAVMSVFAISLAGTGGGILIFLDGRESGVDSMLDAIYSLSLFLIGGGFLFLAYMMLHMLSIFRIVKKNS